MASKSQLIGYAAIIVIVIALASIGMKFTGFATAEDTAVVNITISSSAAINFTTDFTSFGSGSVNTGEASATVSTDANTITGTWQNSTAKLVLENIGNVDVALGLKSDKVASDLLGGTSPEFKYKASGTCVKSYTEFLTSEAAICTPFPFANANDSITFDIKMVIPSDAIPGSKTATVTAIGTYS